ncbi:MULTISPECIES: HNH endonuclease signature motif containing protein [Arthrobacter]|uniref:DUF222 domain-containing protein n=2 Tax=Arthrobacter TaxID=1663 RepID=A0ABU9KM10_9MICC|nr:HNH endonuclease signature motif containing protein [Arthrobacter sp. YJM1]MDP5228122.1 DUF222 domain-containing protein [Arthrobacter sp. YJM1]
MNKIASDHFSEPENNVRPPCFDGFMETTTGFASQDAASDEAADQQRLLAEMISTLESLESSIAGLQALREYTLAMLSRLAGIMAENDDGASHGFADGLWDSRAAEMAERSVAAEAATATRASDRTVQRQMGEAVELLDKFPATFDALFDGRIGLAHVRAIQGAGAALTDPGARAGFESVVVPCAEEQTPSRVRRLAAREAEKAQPELLATRHERAAEERRVMVKPLDDGMAELAAILPAAAAHGIHDRLTRMAKAHVESSAATCPGTVKTGASNDAPLNGRPHKDCRTVDQLRADLLADVLLRGIPSGMDSEDGILAGIVAHVEVTVPVLTLLDGPALGDGPSSRHATDRAGRGRVAAELNGKHPIDPEAAKQLMGNATVWNRVLTDPITGAVLAVDRYRPSEELRRFLTARDSRCRFPGCGIKARELDLDHAHDAALGGETAVGNLAGLCRRHHMLKHHGRWKVRQAGGGDLEWTSPTGRHHVDRPPTPASWTGSSSPRDRKDSRFRDEGGAEHGDSDPPF